jgi:prolyl oligopeptidase
VTAAPETPASTNARASFLPPPTKTADQIDDHFGEAIADPYRWLEDTNAAETAEWVAAQNRATESWLSQFPCREEIRQRLSEMFDYPRFDAPFERGGRWFQTRNRGLEDQSPLYVMSAPEDEGRVLLDPNQMSEDGTVALSELAVTDDGALLAYATSGAGSDWMTWRVRDVETGEDLPDVIEWSKFGSAAWLRDRSGLFYQTAERPEPGSEYLESTRFPRVAFHRTGTPQHEDTVVFEAPDEPDWIPYSSVTEDGRYLVLSISRGTNPEARILVRELGEDGGAAGIGGGLGAGEWRPLVDGFEWKARVISNVGSTFYLLTNHGAERQRIVAIDIDHPDPEAWREVVAEREALLLGARNCGGRLVCHFLEHACSRLDLISLEGARLGEVPLPAMSAIQADFEAPPVEGRCDSPLAHFVVGSFTDSGSLWSYDVETGEACLVRAAGAPVEQEDYVTEQVFVEASDGTHVPVFLVHRKDLRPDGNVPTLLYGYGGFDIPICPGFDRAEMVWIERGGLLAVANLRGGGEYGRAWHEAGRLANKQRVFDDFCDVARWLAGSGWTRAGRIAINGGSNGGLLVGACLTQHPALFGAAVPEVGVLDMLRFHLFTIGWAWKSDFGDPEVEEHYRWLRAYSPLHNIRAGVAYPPTLVMTGDHDDRVVPGHSFKFAAALQAAQAASGSGGPILARIETSAGHGHGKPVSKIIAERADMLTFVEAALGVSGTTG